MQRFDDFYFREPRDRRRPVNRAIRIPVRANGRQRRTAATDGANGHRQLAAETAVRKSEPDTTRSEGAEAPRNDAADWKEKYTRLAAERENERKRLERAFANQAEQEKDRILRDMLPLADNLERALAHTLEPEISLREGVELTLKAFAKTLTNYGVEPIEAMGKPFDPNLHEAVGTIPHPNLPAGTVASVEETGYTVDDRLLRPARVLVVEG